MNKRINIHLDSFNFTKSLYLLLVTIFVTFTYNCSSGGKSDYSPIDDTVQRGSYNSEPIWSDEFNDSNMLLDTMKWNIEMGYGDNNDGWGNDESQNYTDNLNNIAIVLDPDNESNKFLSITARCDDDGICGVLRDGSITSARITTKGKFEKKYGKIEARIQVPNGKSTWPAFWMLGANFPDTAWPKSGEIDIMEIFQTNGSSDKKVNFALHWDKGVETSTSGHTSDTGFKDLSERITADPLLSTQDPFIDGGTPPTDDFHIYSVEWNDKVIIGKVDNQAYYTRTITAETMEEFHKKFFIILNVAVNGTLGGEPDAIKTTPQEMLVDWVRVYDIATAVTNLIPDDGENSISYSSIQESDGINVDVESTAITPYKGNSLIELDFIDSSASSGMEFRYDDTSADISSYDKLKLVINKADVLNLDDLEVRLVDSRYQGGDDDLGDSIINLKDYDSIISTISPSAAQPSSYRKARVFGTPTGWNIYEIPLSDFIDINLDDIVALGFRNPKDSEGNFIIGKIYIDGIELFTDVGTIPTGDNIVINGDFENGRNSWEGNAANVVDDNGNKVNSATIDTAGESFDVNLSQVVAITQGKTYKLSFKAKSDGNRIVAGIGLNEPPWTSSTEIVNLTSEWQTFELELVATNFGIPNSRVIFDMGAATGLVLIDDVSLVVITPPPVGNNLVTIPVDFENTDVTYALTDFDGGAVTVVANPQSSGINTSARVTQMIKDGGQVYGGGFLTLDSAIDFNEGEIFKIKVFSNRAVPVLLKFEGSSANAEVSVDHTGGSTWQELTFDFTGQTSGLGEVVKVVFIFDLGTVGDYTNAPDDWTFYFDDITQSSTITPPPVGNNLVTIPVDFENTDVTYALTDFDGGAVTVVANPQSSGINTSARVTQMIKDGGQVYGGGFLTLDSAIDFNEGEIFKIKVFSNRAVPVLLKFEGSSANAEVSVDHTGGSTWQELTFDFTGQTSGLGEVVKVVFIFDLGTVGDYTNAPDDWTFYFDDITQSSGSGAGLQTNGDLETGDFTGWTNYPNAGTIEISSTENNGGLYSAYVMAGSSQNAVLKYERIAIGTVTPSTQLTISFDMKGTLVDGGVVVPKLVSEGGGYCWQ